MHHPNHPRRHALAGGTLLLSAALLVGCGGGGGGSATPAQPRVQTSVWTGTLTQPDSPAFDAVLAVLADNSTNGTVRFITLPTGAPCPVYQFSGAFVLDPATGAVTSNGPMTVYAPAGRTFNGNPNTQCNFTGSLAGSTLTGTLSGGFSATVSFEADAPTRVPMATMAGVYAGLSQVGSDGNDNGLRLTSTGTFSGFSFPAGTFVALGNGATPDPTLANASLDNGTLQFAPGSGVIARADFTRLGTGAGAVPAEFSGLAILGRDPATSHRIVVFMMDNGTSGFGGLFARVGN